MLTQEDLDKIEAIVERIVDKKLEEKLDQKFKEFEIQLMAKLDVRFKKIERRLTKLEKEVKELRIGLNETIEYFEKRHRASLARFERIERHLGFYNPQDPLILRDKN